MLRTAEVAVSALAGLFFATGVWWAGGALLVVLFTLEVSATRSSQLWMRWRARNMAGLTMVIPAAPSDPGVSQSNADYTAAAKGVLQSSVASNTEIDLLLASGYRLIGDTRHPGWIQQELSQAGPSLKLRVLLLDPECQATRDRAQLAMPDHGVEAYQEGIRAVLAALRHLHRGRGAQVDVRLYTREPVWQLAIVQKEVLVFSASQRPTDVSPIYVLRRGLTYGLSWGYEHAFACLWSDDSSPYDLDNAAEPDWSKVYRIDDPSKK